MMVRFLGIFLVGCSTLNKETDPNGTVFESEQGDSHILQVGDTTAASYFLRSDKNELVLIDTGGSDNNPVLAQLAAEGATPEDVQKIFLTHAHGNHIGGIHLFPNAEIYALETERNALLEKEIVLDVGLTNHQILSLGNSELEIIAVPGHSMGNAAYRFDDILIMGDSAIASSNSTIEPILSNSDDPILAHDSLIVLKEDVLSRQIEFAYMLFSHSEPLSGIEALLAYE